MKTPKIKKFGTLIEHLNDHVNLLLYYMVISRDPTNGWTRVDIKENFTGQNKVSCHWTPGGIFEYEIPDEVLAAKMPVINGTIHPYKSTF